jgi:hypothetical protein
MPIEYWRSVSRLGQLCAGMLKISSVGCMKCTGIHNKWCVSRTLQLIMFFIANCQLQNANCKLNKHNHPQLITREPYSILAEAAKNIAE